MRYLLIVLTVLMYSTALAGRGDWDKVLQSRKLHENVVLTWSYSYKQEGFTSRTESQIELAREQFKLQLQEQGFSGQELEQRLRATMANFEDTSAKEELGYILCRSSKKLTSVDSFLPVKNVSPKNTFEPNNAVVAEYWNGEESTRFFGSRNEPSVVELNAPNPFSHAHMTELEIFALALFDITNIFAEANLTKIEGDYAFFEVPVNGRDNYYRTCKLQLSTGIPVEVCLEEKSIKRVDHRCLVMQTSSIGGEKVPSDVLMQVFQKDGSLFSSAHYKLIDSKFDDSFAGDYLKRMGREGVSVIDGRLGAGHEIVYLYPDHLPSLDELKKLGKPFEKRPISTPASNQSYGFAIGLGLISIGLLLVALRMRKRSG